MAVVILALTPALGLIAYTSSDQERVARATAQEEALQLAQLAAAHQALLIEGARQLLVGLTQFRSVQQLDTVACRTEFAEVHKQFPQYSILAAVRPNGDYFCQSVGPYVPVNIADRDYFQRTVQTRTFTMSGYIVGRTTGRSVISLSHPVVDGSGAVRAVVFVGLDLAWLNDFVARTVLPRGTALGVIDGQGILLARYPDGEKWVGRSVPKPTLAKILGRREGRLDGFSADSVSRLGAFTTLPGHEGQAPTAYVLVGIPRDVALAEVSRQRTRNVIGLLLIGLGALLVTWIGGDALILRPVRALIAATRRLGAGDLTARAMLARARGELGELALAFDDMAASVEQHSTARSEAEAHVRRVNRALRVLSECNKALVRATEEQALLEAICRVVVNLGGYRFAWVGFKEDHEAKTVRPVAHAGHDDGHRASLNVTWADDESRHGAVGTAVRTGQPSIVNDVSTDPAAVLWRADAVRWGYAAVVALPLLDGARPFGALAIYAAEPNAFAAEEVDLLTELANDLAYGIVAWRTRAELDRQQEARHQSDKLATMGEMLAGVAHELNNPLTVVSGRAALLRAELGGGPLEGHVTKMDQAAQRCARIVRNFLALARQHPPERQEVQLNQIVREAVELLAYPLRVDNVEVRFELAEDLPSLWADSHQLHQVVVNLVTNADHAMRTSDAPRRITLTTLFHAAEARALLRVIDTGPGIPPTIRARIFEPFFTTKPPGQGTGLGLSLCQGLVESHGGRIHVESEPGHGAVFTIELPVVMPAEEQRAVKVLPGGPRISGKAILIVDDEADVGELLADLLGRDRNQIDIVGDGGAALARIGERSYDLIVSDIRMPGLDGPEFYEALEQRAPQLLRRFVFITGDTLNTDIRAFLERTRAATLMKPLDFDAVQRMIGAVLETP